MKTRSKKMEADLTMAPGQGASGTRDESARDPPVNKSNVDTTKEAERNSTHAEKTYVFRGDRACMALVAAERERHQEDVSDDVSAVDCEPVPRDGSTVIEDPQPTTQTHSVETTEGGTSSPGVSSARADSNTPQPGGEECSPSTPIGKKNPYFCRNGKVTVAYVSPYKFIDQARDGIPPIAVSMPLPASTQTQCSNARCLEYNDDAMADRYTKCGQCGGFSYDYSPHCLDSVDMTPGVTEKEKTCFLSIKPQLMLVVKNMHSDGGVSHHGVQAMGAIKHEAIKGGILMREGNLKPWTEHLPLQEALGHCLGAIEEMDIKGFRFAFHATFFHMLVSYPTRRNWSNSSGMKGSQTSIPTVAGVASLTTAL